MPSKKDEQLASTNNGEASSKNFEFIRSHASLRDSQRYMFQRKVTPDYFEQVQSRDTWN
jgi:hypothetical protein